MPLKQNASPQISAMRRSSICLCNAKRGLGLLVFAHQGVEFFGRYYLLFYADGFLGNRCQLRVSYTVDEVLLRALVLKHTLRVVLKQLIRHRSHTVHSELILSYDESELLKIFVRNLYASSFEQLTLDAVEGDIIEDLRQVTVEVFYLSFRVTSEEDTLEEGFIVSNLTSLREEKITKASLSSAASRREILVI